MKVEKKSSFFQNLKKELVYFFIIYAKKLIL